jgi:UDP-N-acetylmuramoylalanine--D-glutamate ligase
MSKSILEKLDLKVTKVPFSLKEKLEKGAFSIDENFVVKINEGFQ